MINPKQSIVTPPIKEFNTETGQTLPPLPIVKGVHFETEI